VIFGSPLLVLYAGSFVLAAIVVILYIYLFNSAREASLFARLRVASATGRDSANLQRSIAALQERQLRTISYLRYGGLLLFGLVFVYAIQYGLYLFATNSQKVKESNEYWKRRDAAATSYVRLSSSRLFSVYDDRVAAGSTPADNDSLVITAEIHDPSNFRRCSASDTADIERSAAVSISAPSMELSDDPIVQVSQSPCYVRWNWIGAPRNGGDVYALLGVTLHEPRSAAPVKATKLLDIRVQQPFDFNDAVPLVAGLLSLVGAVATTMLSAFLSRKTAESHPAT